LTREGEKVKRRKGEKEKRRKNYTFKPLNFEP
jgi:hypothetical protein